MCLKISGRSLSTRPASLAPSHLCSRGGGSRRRGRSWGSRFFAPDNQVAQNLFEHVTHIVGDFTQGADSHPNAIQLVLTGVGVMGQHQEALGIRHIASVKRLIAGFAEGTGIVGERQLVRVQVHNQVIGERAVQRIVFNARLPRVPPRLSGLFA